MAKKLSAAVVLLLCLSASARAADHYCTTSSQLTTALANAVGGDTITLQAGNTFVGPFTLRSGLTSTVTVRSSAHASLPAGDVRVTDADRANMPVIHCGNATNDPCFATSGTDADNWRLTGLEMRPKPGVTTSNVVQLGNGSADSVVADTPNNIEIDHCYIHAPEAGSVRGIFLGGRNVNIHDNHISGFRKNGQECQAIGVQTAPGPLVIRNNYLSALGEVVLTAGSGLPAATMPANLTMTRNYLEVPQKYNPWRASVFDEADAPWSAALPCTVSSSGTTVTCNGHGRTVEPDSVYVIKLTSGPQAGEKRTVFGVPTANTLRLTEAFSANQSGASATLYGFFIHKNNFELKMLTGANNLIEGNVFDGAWGGAQKGYAIVFTVRTDELTGSPHAVVENVTFRYNYVKRAWSGVNILSSDDVFPSDYMRNLTISHNLFEGLGSSLYGFPGQVRLDAIQIANGGAHGSDDLTISHNTFVHAQATPLWGSTLFFAGDDSTTARRHTDLVFKDNIVSFETEGIRSEGGLHGTAGLGAAANSFTYSHNVLYRALTTAPTGYPTTNNWYETSSAPLGWADAANGDYSLSSGDYRAGQSRQASDGTNVGADIATLSSKIGASSNAYATATIKAVTGLWRTNVAAAANGATAAATSTLDSNRTPAAAINGDRRGIHWGSDPSTGSGWHDATNNAFPDSLEVTFAGARTIDEVDVFTVQDAYTSPSEPTEAMTFSLYGVTNFTVEYWDASSSAWATVPGGAVSGNDKVWRKITFATVTTTKIRVSVSAALAGYSRVVEVEAWTPARLNHAAAANGATATASSTLDSNRTPAAAINGDRKGLHWGTDPSTGSGWHDSTQNSYDDWLQIDFAGTRTISEVDVFTVQDSYTSPSEPTETMTFSLYGVVEFDVEYWNGSAWTTVTGGAVTGNNKVWRKVTFPSVTTDRIRILVKNAQGGYSRITEVEAY
jgi:hypothetical protein